MRRGRGLGHPQVARPRDLVEARKNQRFLSIRCIQMEKPPDNVEQNIPRENGFAFGLVGPEISNPELTIDVGIPGPSVVPSIEGKKASLAVLQPRSHGHVVPIYSEMNERAAAATKQLKSIEDEAIRSKKAEKLL